MATQPPPVYTARLHWVGLLFPILLLILGVLALFSWPILKLLALLLLFVGAGSLLIEVINMQYAFMNIYPDRVRLQRGFLSRQIVDVPYQKMESVDVRQPMLGCLLNFGSIILTGTGGNSYFMNRLRAPLTCRRYIEQAMFNHDPASQ